MRWKTPSDLLSLSSLLPLLSCSYWPLPACCGDRAVRANRRPAHSRYSDHCFDSLSLRFPHLFDCQSPIAGVSHRIHVEAGKQTMTDVHSHAEDIHEQFADHADITVDEVEERLDTLVNDYQVPVDEARRSVTSTYYDRTEVDQESLSNANEHRDLGTIDTAEEWIDITAKVVELWEPRSDSIAQVGLLGDDTGRIKFTSWAKSDLPTLEDGDVYHFGNVVTDEYRGQYSVKLNRTTTIEETDEEIEVGDNTTEIEGALVDIQSGSGLIKRCPTDDCTRVLQNGRCSEHGEVEGEFDLRIKGVIDNGRTVHEVIFNQEMTEELADISLDEAKDRAMDALDTTVVADDISDEVLGQYYRIAGPVLGRYVLADEFEQLGARTDAEDVLITARSL
jgi:replication factor A1